MAVCQASWGRARRPLRLLALGGMLGALNGCLFWGGVAPELRSAQSRVESLADRVSRLEQIRGLSAPLDAVPAAESAPLALSAGGALSGPEAELISSPVLGGGEAGALAQEVSSGARPSWVPQIAWGKALGKLARGAINTITGWVEIPKRSVETSKASGAGPGLTVGVLRGVGHGFVRTVAGIYEMVTFPFPAPPGYRPVIRPDYVFTCEGLEPQEPSSWGLGQEYVK